MTTRRMLRAALVVLALVGAGCASKAPEMPAIADNAGNAHVPGKFVWVDLFTSDPEGAKAFYGGLFGWTFEPVGTDGAYTVIRSGGRKMGGILKVKPAAGAEKSARWIAYVSVEDVDAAIRQVKAAGGRLEKGPLDVPGRGRGAVVTDPQGGYFIVFRSATGDPADGRTPALNDWMWIDYCAASPGQAVTFYNGLLGWKQELAGQAAGMEYYVFKQGERMRAGLFKNPWPKVRSQWIPYVRVEDPAALAAKAAQLGGRVAVSPSPEIRGGTTALLVDPAGAGFIIQKASL